MATKQPVFCECMYCKLWVTAGHKARGAELMRIRSLVTIKVRSESGHNALNCRGRTPELRFDKMSNLAPAGNNRVVCCALERPYGEF